MNKPKINLKSDIVKIITPAQAGIPGDGPIYRHFFNWTYADTADSIKELAGNKVKAIPLRVQLYSAGGGRIGNLMAATVTPLSERWLYVDAPERAIGFGFHTINLFKRSQECLDTITAKSEDLTKL